MNTRPKFNRRVCPFPVFPGFENINRYWDASQEAWTAKILPGEYYVSCNREVIATVLGSCVSACIRDPRAKIGGMNHFMLPESGGNDWGGLATRYGFNAMEQLINSILKRGGRRENLEVKIFGGGRIINQVRNIGASNVEFVRRYLHTERMHVVAEDVLGDFGRKLFYDPLSGKAKVKYLPDLKNDTVVRREREYQSQITTVPQGDIELF